MPNPSNHIRDQVYGALCVAFGDTVYRWPDPAAPPPTFGRGRVKVALGLVRNAGFDDVVPSTLDLNGYLTAQRSGQGDEDAGGYLWRCWQAAMSWDTAHSSAGVQIKRDRNDAMDLLVSIWAGRDQRAAGGWSRRNDFPMGYEKAIADQRIIWLHDHGMVRLERRYGGSGEMCYVYLTNKGCDEAEHSMAKFAHAIGGAG